MQTDLKQVKIGLIGLGDIGCPIGLNLMEKGYSLLVHALHRKSADSLCKEGAQWAASIAELAGQAGVIITVLPMDEQVIDVYTGPEGIIKSMSMGSVCLEMTSCRGETIKKITDYADELGKQIRILDAPVSGGPANAKTGALTIMAGGDKPLYDYCYPLLNDMGKKIFYTGKLGSGKAFKMINQVLNAGNTIVAAEAMLLAKKMDLDIDTLYNVIKESSGNSWVFENNVQKFMMQEQFDFGFKLRLLKKDISLAMDEVRQGKLVLPVFNLIYQLYQAMENQGAGDKNYNIISQWIRQQNAE